MICSLCLHYFWQINFRAVKRKNRKCFHVLTEIISSLPHARVGDDPLRRAHTYASSAPNSMPRKPNQMHTTFIVVTRAFLTAISVYSCCSCCCIVGVSNCCCYYMNIRRAIALLLPPLCTALVVSAASGSVHATDMTPHKQVYINIYIHLRSQLNVKLIYVDRSLPCVIMCIRWCKCLMFCENPNTHTPTFRRVANVFTPYGCLFDANERKISYLCK